MSNRLSLVFRKGGDRGLVKEPAFTFACVNTKKF